MLDYKFIKGRKSVTNKMTNKLQNTIGLILLGAIFASLLFLTLRNPEKSLGSVVQGNEYNSTTTPLASAVTSTTTSARLIRVLKVGGGSLAQVTITGVRTSDTASLAFYDATTTNITKRNRSTTTLATFASTTAGTYTFDAAFSDGLIVEVGEEDTSASSTITWR